MEQTERHEGDELPEEELLAFEPIHKRYFGTAIGTVAALVIFVFTIVDVLQHAEGDRPLCLLDQYFYGYTVSIPGAFIGALWGFFVGWVGGWFVAFCRNFAIAVAIFWVRARANLQASRDFLDHI
jgi:hypothetical protein